MIMEKICSKAIEWFKNDETVRAVILVGSHAENRPTDEWSDYDLSVFCTSDTAYIDNHDWLASMGKVWVCLPESLSFDHQTFPTRLVIFEGGFKIDFAFYPIDTLKQLVKTDPLPDYYNMGYRVLLDKDKLAKNLPKPAYEGFKEVKPTEQEFISLIEEFWFEAYHVAKYLKRGDLWSVKFRSGYIQDHLLLKMIVWNEAAKHNWNYTTHPIGKRLQEWVSKSTWEVLFDVFAHFDQEDSWEKFLNMVDLFRKLSSDTAELLNYTYPKILEQNMMGFIFDTKK